MNRVVAAVAALILATPLLAACTTPEPAPAVEALRPELALATTDGPVRVGVLVPPVEGEGSEFRPLVEGVRVAAYRFGMTGADVELLVGLDDGTADGARRAVERLVADEVVGVVVASRGAHVGDALGVAAEAETAVLLPYGNAAAPPGGTWSVAPDGTAIADAVRAALVGAGATRPYRATAAGREPGAPATRAGALDDPGATAHEVVALLEAREIDSVVVDGPAAEQAALVVALQGLLGDRQLPVVLTPEALTPRFGDLLAESGATGARLLSVGTDTQDHVALTRSAAGQRAAVFTAALRLAAGDPSCRNVYADDGCAVGLPHADVASHDAAVALVRAVEAARSTDPGRVRTALGGLRLGRADGLAGPDLDLTVPQALSGDDVVVLHASTSDPGVRPTVAGAPASSLFWFAGTVP